MSNKRRVNDCQVLKGLQWHNRQQSSYKQKALRKRAFLFITYCSKGIIDDIGTAFYLKH
jgi:hypothetical protein